MRTIHYDPPGERAYVIGPHKPPVARVKRGETFAIDTLDAYGNKVTSAEQDITKLVSVPYVNPVTGPVYVEGAEKGDTLAVKIESITITREYGVSAIMPEFGGLCATNLTRTLNPPLPARLMIHPIRDGFITFDERWRIACIPAEPFYGTMGVSPETEAISTLSPGPHGGNMDAADICPGNTIFFPVNVSGALLYVGDGHAAQGDGEVCGVAVEVPTRGVLTVEVMKGRKLETPRVESSEYLMSVGSARPMEDAARIAFHDLLMWLETDYGLDRLVGYQLASQVARVRLANMVDTLYTVVAKFPKRYLPQPPAPQSP
jgi:acetamidase/formamidase